MAVWDFSSVLQPGGSFILLHKWQMLTAYSFRWQQWKVVSFNQTLSKKKIIAIFIPCCPRGIKADSQTWFTPVINQQYLQEVTFKLWNIYCKRSSNKPEFYILGLKISTTYLFIFTSCVFYIYNTYSAFNLWKINLVYWVYSF